MLLGLGALAIVILGACYDPDGLQADREAAQFEVFEERLDSSGGEEPAGTPVDPAATPDPDDPASAVVQGMPVGDYFLASCSACHGVDRAGGVGLPLLREGLTEPDDFYAETIIDGREGTAMTAYGGGAVLTDDEVSWIVNWLKNTDP
jgi:mono/diheme cytochrome c family protein